MQKEIRIMTARYPDIHNKDYDGLPMISSTAQ